MSDWNDMTNRERDALVAEEVMGYTKCEPEYDEETNAIVCTKSPQHVLVSGLKDYDNPDVYIKNECWLREYHEETFCPRFTTHAAPALQVAEKMREDGYEFEIPRIIYSQLGNYWDAEHAETANAICLDALRAEGVDVG